MGIPGLTTYISNHSDRYLEYFELHDSYLVVDGNSIACQLYNWHAKCNCAFGGDYDKYARCVRQFFESLERCNIIPLVIFDGACEDKKLKTAISRTRDRIRTARFLNPLTQSRNKLFPLFLQEVFKDVLREKSIKHAQCFFEADNTIAAIAKILGCPVLSYDSDFYIYGALYIPFNTLENDITKSKGMNCKCCKIYRVESLLHRFKGLDQTLLPLAAILLGNDYVRRGMFKNFFSNVKLLNPRRKKLNEQQRRIEATLNWLRHYTLNDAVTRILQKLPKQKRKKILEIIETLVNGYTSASTDILMFLGFSEEDINRKKKCNRKTYKFQGDINDDCAEEILNSQEPLSSDGDDDDDDDDDNTSQIANVFDQLEGNSYSLLVNNLPPWFLNDFKTGKFPSYFIDILIRNLYICPVQIEDYFYSSSVLISLNIVNILYKLLTKNAEEEERQLNYMIRGENNRLVCRQLVLSDNTFMNLPCLIDLPLVPETKKKLILNNTLGITQKDLDQFPCEWTLYIAALKYWAEKQDSLIKFTCHIYSLLFLLLINIVDCKVGVYRTLQKYRKKYSIERLEEIKKKKVDKSSQHSVDTTIIKARKEVTIDDCLLAIPVLITHFEMDCKLYSNPKKFNVAIVHAFSEFQNCLRYAMNLNALLGFPHQQTKVADLLNGTFFYNLCINFKSRSNIDFYVYNILKDSPTLLNVFNVILAKVKTLLAFPYENAAVVNHKKRPGHKVQMI